VLNCLGEAKYNVIMKVSAALYCRITLFGTGAVTLSERVMQAVR